MGETLVEAISPEMNGPDGCNEGFLRDDALLFVTFVRNTGDFDSAGTPDDWKDALLGAKHGDPHSIVLLDIGLYKPLCAMPKIDRVCKLIRQFPYWHSIDWSEPGYVDAFKFATDLVETACAEFIPG